MKIDLPVVYGIHHAHALGQIRQIARPSVAIEAAVADYRAPGVRGKLVAETDITPEILVVTKRPAVPTSHLAVIYTRHDNLSGPADRTDLRACEWLAHPESLEFLSHTLVVQTRLNAIVDSWKDAFAYKAEDIELQKKGLRPPQIGAIHATHAHWTVSQETATIVMPTGTGKTETMIGILLSTPCPRVLVIVPTDALRTQLAAKFLTLGILPSMDGVIARTVRYPVVGTLLKRPTSESELNSFLSSCHVIVTTSHIAGQCEKALQQLIAERCPYLFIDEAHHAEAPTWLSFKQHFKNHRVVQFTATPFREDGKSLDGKVVYKYPLRKAQTEGYFKAIRFDSVEEFDSAKVDEAIAQRAIHHLRADSTGKHIVMARVGNVPRAAEIFQIYERYPEFNPVQLHTGVTAKSVREAAREAIITGRSRIVVCVDMLGEGFDLPELKIAAFHDIRKSLAVTLQLAGRFTRSRSDLGEPVFIANVADVVVRDELWKLYTRDPDWNQLLPEFSDAAIDEQISLKEFVDGFANLTDDIPIKRIRPATSTVIYKTNCSDWDPENFKEGILGSDRLERIHYDVNHQRRTLIVVTARKDLVPWAHNDQIYDWIWDLLVVFWNERLNLLFVNSSSNEGVFKSLARAIAGDDVELVNENVVFRSFAGVNRLRLQNVGLTEQFGRLIRYTGRMGADVGSGISEAQKRNTRRTVLSGRGFEGGTRVTVGASRKGRIWSMQRANVEQLCGWCAHIGKKILDESIDPDEVLKGTLESKPIGSLPASPAIMVDWPEVIYTEPEAIVSFRFDNMRDLAIWEADIELDDSDVTDANKLRFLLRSDAEAVYLTLKVFETSDGSDFCFEVEDGMTVDVRLGAGSTPIQTYFYENPPVVWFADGASLEGNNYTPLKASYLPFPKDRLVVWEWDGVDLTVESQGPEKRGDSIQHRVIEVTKRGTFDIIFDDDGAGEAADVVAIKTDGRGHDRAICVELYHCKYSKREPGRRIKDMYEVCGQAQKSVHWMVSDDKRTDLFTHLLRREAGRKSRGQSSRLEVGDVAKLKEIREMSRSLPLKLSIFIVQPGVSREHATSAQLELVSVTENYLLETYQLAFGFICSE